MMGEGISRSDIHFEVSESLDGHVAVADTHVS
jgi:hypothetical protein